MKKKIQYDYLEKNKLNLLNNIIGNIKFNLNKNYLPYGAHWIYFNENYSLKELGNDGHPKRGTFFPLLKGYKRMFAGSELFFKKNMSLNKKIKKQTNIESIIKKKSNNNNLYFVTVESIYKDPEDVLLKEIQSIVFIKNNHISKKNNKINILLGLKLIKKKAFRYNNIDLFRSSALTYNSHKIHYDYNFATKEEGHKDLLVHGPLIATKVLCECHSLYDNKIKYFQFKINKPIYVNQKMLLKIYAKKKCSDNVYIYIFNIYNEIAFTGKIKLKS